MATALRARNIETPRILIIASIRQSKRQEAFIEQFTDEFPSSPIPDVEDGSLFRRNRARTVAKRRLRKAHDEKLPYNAVFCTNDESAYGVIDALRELSSDLDDIPIVFGYDGLEETLNAIERENSPVENTVIQSTDKFADISINLLKRKLDGFEIPAINKLNPSLYL